MPTGFNRRQFLSSSLGTAGLLMSGGLAMAADAPVVAEPADRSKDAPTAPVSVQRCESYEPAVVRARLNAAIDQVRRTPAMQDVQQASIYNGQMDDPLAAAIDLERQELMRKAVEELPDEQRQAVVLHVYADLTFEQVAEMLGEPLPTIASRYRRALDRLKTTMQKLV